MYEVFEHTADVGLRVRAGDLPSLMQDAAQGLFSLIVANLDDVGRTVRRDVAVSGDAWDYVLFDWLSELLYYFDVERLVFGEFEVRLVPGGIEAVALGEPVDPARHLLEHEVKAITYHGLKVEESAGGWLAEFVVDI
jgi:SHS2 domain-containing protein